MRCTHTEQLADRERRCVKQAHDESKMHLMGTIRTLLDRVGLNEAEEANA